jgi:hypothetical protein
MTVMTKPEQLWSTMPGWGIVADLTPPELIASRHLKFLRKLMFTGLAVLLVICACAYAAAFLQHSSASSALSDQQFRTSQLRAESGKYAGVTQIQGNVAQIESQVTKVMVGDIDLPKLLLEIRAALPGAMTIKQQSLTLSSASGPVGGAAIATQLDTSGHTRIGTVSLSGSGRTLDDLSRFIDKLKTVTGVVDPIPTSNQVDQGAVSYSLSLGITDQVLSHRFDHISNGSK